MAHRISGTGSAPIELYTLVAISFIDCNIMAFHMKTTCLHNLVDSNPKSLSSDDIIHTLKNKFHSLKAQGLWSNP